MNTLLNWFELNGRKFLWRKNNISLYKLLGCEIFLWKTRASTVSSFINSFFEKYCTPKKIETTSIAVLKKDIKKLGLYNRRAKQLKQTFTNFSNRNVPKSEREFRIRFKVGQYIARSALSIYSNQNLFPVDQNIDRFLKRVFNYNIRSLRIISMKDEVFLKDFINKAGKKIIWVTIDFASMICKNRNPECDNCILNKYCFYYNSI